MTPQFTTPCYVRIEDADKRKEVCKKLEEIGYHVFRAINNPSGDMIFTDLFFADGSYTNEPTYAIWKKHMVLSQLRNTHIDCGTNTELFLALSGMRSDTDKGQWFFDLLGNDWICKQDNLPEKFRLGNFHRATAAEIIEHFNNKTK